MTKPPHNVAKAEWKKFYRLYRVTLRETWKAKMDMMIFGTGFVHYKYGQDPEYIPADKVRIEP